MSEPSRPHGDPTRDRAPRSTTPGERAAGLWRALQIGIVATSVLALFDLGVALNEIRGVPWGGPPAFDLMAAALGSFFWSHALIALPIALAVGWWNPGHTGWVAGAVVAGAGGLAAGSLLAEGGRGLPGLIAGFAAATVLGAGLARTLSTKRGAPSLPPGPALKRAAVLGLALAVCASVFFLRSPWFDPGEFRAPTPAAWPARGPASSEPPNVLWVVLDTARADRMSLHGYAQPTTPFLATLGESSAVFDATTSDGTWTAPSHASMFTGLSVRAHGVGRTTPVLSADFDTTAQRLSEAGYRTASFSNNPLIDEPTGLSRGFQDVHLPTHLRILGRSSLQRVIDRAGLTPPLPWLDADHGAALTNDRIAGWLERNQAGPVFLFVNYTEAHLPWEIPERHRRTFLTAEESARSRALRWRVHGDIEDALNRRVARDGTGFLDARDTEILRGQYDATLRYLDERVAELVRLFEAAGIWQDTLLIVTSDHGEYLGTHELWSHLYRTYQELTHVALLVRPPGGQPARRVETPVLLSDLHATVLAATLGEPPKAGHGRDLLALGPEPPPRHVVSEAGPIGAQAAIGARPFRQADSARGRRLARPEIAIRDQRYKLVRPEGGPPELYDLLHDPGERQDLVGHHPEIARRLMRELRSFETQVPEHQPSREELLGHDSPLGKALRALGYVDD